MEENITQEVTTKDVLKHYLASILVYGLVLLLITFCPILNDSIENDSFNYILFFLIYYICYIVFALPIFLKIKPQSILQSRNVTILEYIKRQFKKVPTAEFVRNITPEENEKQALVITFMKAFFGFYSINLLCNKFLPSLGYNIDFLKEMFIQAHQYTQSAGLYAGIFQYIDDSSDMWIKIITMFTTIILAFSYITELDLFKNKIKSVDTTPLGVITCIMCYYPFMLLSTKIIPTPDENIIPVDNFALRITLNILIILANFGILIAVGRLGTKSGNLTNRGIVTGFPYNIVRHPNYIMQICYIIFTTIPVYFSGLYPIETILLTAGLIGWAYVYYLRAITEERHLIQDEAYQQYVEKVKYRFIPKVF